VGVWATGQDEKRGRAWSKEGGTGEEYDHDVRRNRRLDGEAAGGYK